MSTDANTPTDASYSDWLTSVSDDWRQLQSTPDVLKDEALCRAALALDGGALKFVPESLKTDELCMLAAEHRTEFKFIPEEHLDHELICTVVRNNPLQVREVPAHLMTSSILAEYVRTGSAYDLYELCQRYEKPMERIALMVVTSSLEDLDTLPGYAMTANVFSVAEQLYSAVDTKREWQSTKTRHNPNYLESKMPRERLKELQADPTAFQHYYIHMFFKAWAVFWDDEFLKRMIEKGDSRIISSIPGHILNEEVCFAAVSKYGLSLRYVPGHLRTLPVCIQAVQSNSAAMAFTPKHMRAEIEKALG